MNSLLLYTRPPTRALASNSVAWMPRRLSAQAAAKPEKPPPTTATRSLKSRSELVTCKSGNAPLGMLMEDQPFNHRTGAGDANAVDANNDHLASAGGVTYTVASNWDLD